MTDDPAAALSRRTVLLLPFFTGAGIILQIRTAAGIPLPAAVILFAAVLAAALVPRSRGTALVLVPLCFFAAGSMRARTIFPPPDRLHVANLIHEQTDAAVAGAVVSVQSRSPEQSRFTVECDRLTTEADGTRPCRGRISFVMYGELPADIVAGERVTVRGRVRPAGTIMTPGVNDYRLYLARTRVWTTGTVTKNLVVRLAGENGSPPMNTRLERMRQQAREFIARNVKGDSGAIYRALLTGDTSAIRPGLRKAFARTGTAHLLAISGMHMGAIFVLALVLTTAIAAILPALLLRLPLRKLAGAVALAPLATYALTAGMKPPVFRAAVMTAAFILIVAADRRYSAAAALALAATLVMLVFPASLLSASFQLSFAAVSVIIMLWKKLRPWHARLAARRTLLFLATVALSGIAAQAGTLPFSLRHFNMISPLSVPATVLLLPLLCFWALPLGLTALAAAPFFPKAAAVMLRAGSPAIDAATAVITRLAANPDTVLYVPDPPWLMAAIYFAALVILYRRIRRPAGFLAALIVLPVLFSSAAVMVPAITRNIAPRPRTVFLDVGQGSSAVIFTPGGHILLIDAGGSSSPRFDPGERIIAQYLFHEGVRRLDAVVLTHAHADHTNGLAVIAEIFRPRVIWTNGSTENRDLAETLAKAAARGSRIRTARAGMRLFAGADAELRCLKDGGGARGNAGSLVLFYRGGGTKIIFPGDIPLHVQRKMAEENKIPGCGVLLAPHHGSPAYFEPIFAQTAGPEVVVISTGASGRIAPEWRSRKLLPPPEITARSGAIEIAADGNGGITVRHPWLEDGSPWFRSR